MWLSYRGPSLWAILCCFPTHISQDVDKKWSGWDLDRCSERGCSCGKWLLKKLTVPQG